MVKYVVLDLSNINPKELGELLSQAYKDGYNDGISSMTGTLTPCVDPGFYRSYNELYGISTASGAISENTNSITATLTLDNKAASNTNKTTEKTTI